MKSFRRYMVGGGVLALLLAVLVPFAAYAQNGGIMLLSADDSRCNFCGSTGTLYCRGHHSQNNVSCIAQCSSCSQYDTYLEIHVHHGGGHSHDYNQRGDLVSAATCTQAAVYKKKCSCGAQEGTMTVGTALGHSYTADGATVSEATCTAAKVVKTKCSRCSSTSGTHSVGSPLGHAMGSSYVWHKAGCTYNGDYRSDCSRCSHYTTSGISAKGHISWTNGTVGYVNSNGITNGEKRYFCNRSGNSEYDACSALLHQQWWGQVYTRYETVPDAYTDYSVGVAGAYRDSGSVLTSPNPLTAAQYHNAGLDGAYYTGVVQVSQPGNARYWYITYYRKRTYINYDGGVR